MAKYSYEFKTEVVQAYLNGEGGYGYLAKKYNIASEKSIKCRVNAYKEFGKVGIMRSRKKKISLQFKLFVVESYLTSELSYQELALKNGMTNPSLISKWVNDFRIAGPDALRSKKKDQKKLYKDTKNNSKEKIILRH